MNRRDMIKSVALGGALGAVSSQAIASTFKAEQSALPPIEAGEGPMWLLAPLKIGDEVVDVLDVHGRPHQTIGDADLLANLRGDRRVGHGGGKLDEALDAAQALGEGEHLTGRAETLRRREIALQLEADHAAEAAHLLARKRMLRM